MRHTAERLLAAIKAKPRGSYREWAAACGIKSTSSVRYRLSKLEEEGKVRRPFGAIRAVEIVGAREEDQIRIAIKVLRAYAAGLRLDNELLAELEQAITDAAAAQDDDTTTEPPCAALGA